jgi:hypothetical protein
MDGKTLGHFRRLTVCHSLEYSECCFQFKNESTMAATRNTFEYSNEAMMRCSYKQSLPKWLGSVQNSRKEPRQDGVRNRRRVAMTTECVRCQRSELIFSSSLRPPENVSQKKREEKDGRSKMLRCGSKVPDDHRCIRASLINISIDCLGIIFLFKTSERRSAYIWRVWCREIDIPSSGNGVLIIIIFYSFTC